MAAYANEKKGRPLMVDIPYSDVVNQNFQVGSEYLKSVANGARKAYCTWAAIGESVPDITDLLPPEIKGLQREFLRYVCERPEEPILLPPAERLPPNSGACNCQPYRITYAVIDSLGAEDPPGSLELLGPISVVRDNKVESDGSITYRYRAECRGFADGSPCGAVQRVNLVTSGSDRVRIRVISIAPSSLRPFVACDRLRLPVDRRIPDNRNFPRPTVNIPVPNLPTINLPVIPVPFPALPGVKFEPKLILDVGGINIEFNLGGVNISLNPTFVAPILITPPGFFQPSLPPLVNPLPSATPRDCCDEIIANIASARGEIEVVRSEVIETQTISDNILSNALNIQNVSLEDIKKCVCLPETQLFSSVGNVQDYIFPAGDEELAFVTISVIGGGDRRKVFGTPGGEPVAISGWYAFGRSGRYGERQGIDYANSLVIPPGRGWNTFTFSVYNGLRANIQLHTYKRTS